MPDLPLSDAKYKEAKKEISKRSAEMDNNTEDQFDAVSVPDILKEHFKRNSEEDDTDAGTEAKVMVDGEVELSRRHRAVTDDEMEVVDEQFEKLME